MYKHWRWDFNDNEIDQIVELASYYGSGVGCSLLNRWQALDRRKVTKQVFEWATVSGVIVRGSEILTWEGGEWKNPFYVREGGKDRWYIATDHKFSYVHYLPAEAMWRMVKPIFERGKGYYTITSAKEWHNFGIWCSKDDVWNKQDEAALLRESYATYSEARYIPFMMDILNELQQNGYIWFQYAGTVWQVTIRKEHSNAN